MNINATIIGQSITFVIFMLFCMKYIWPVITTAMAEREQKIKDGLEAADRADKALELAQEEAGLKLREAKQEAAAILDAANKRANQLVEEAKDQARTEGERLKAAAEAEVEQEVNRAKEELRAQVAVLAIAGAEKILGSQIDAAANEELVNKLAAEL
ncbi:ATP synthase F0 subcomplex B subunit [Sinobacterium caligoides]|uniref:ATP synthase subunit b n=1 Tax=Sinobacterium caligoides TaxID=933926 RepID=A0A3N2DGW4_9GAMM|nr:F0F1 ATP synthase subunit B [Sinobacterium caligoides]ROR99040.1 ATP synthase F0 subcomplex B subunit [Sinobacterium caligoides]